MKIYIYVRGSDKSKITLVTTMMKVCGIVHWEVIDLNIKEPSNMPDHIGIAFGRTTARLAKNYTSKVYTLPTLDKLTKDKKNASYRTEAWDKLRKIKASLKSVADKDKKEWTYAILLKGKQKICVYDGPRPDVEADSFITREDVSMLNKVKQIFQADTVLLDKEDEDTL